jgi:hypothetical protein
MLAVEWSQGVQDAWNRIANFVPKFIAFLVILVIGWFVAKALSKLVDKVLERVGFDRAVERGGVGQALARSKYDPSDILGLVVFWAIFLIALQLAFGVFGPNPISDLIRAIVGFLPNVFVAIIILVIAGALARVVTDVLIGVLATASGGRWIAQAAGIAIWVFGFFAALNQLHIAPAIVNGLYFAILALVVGAGIVAVGGGGIRTMQRYWELGSVRVEQTATEARQGQATDGEVRRETREELYARAAELDIEGRSTMTRDELERAVRREETRRAS